MPHHDGRIHGREIDLSHSLVQAEDRLIDQASLVGHQELRGAFEPLWLPLIPGDEDAVLKGSIHLHGGDAGARGTPGHPLQGDLGEARELDQPFQASRFPEERVAAIYMPTPEQGIGGGLRKDPTVREIGAPPPR